MGVLDQGMTNYLVSVLQNKMPIEDFETWLYENEERLEEELGS